MLLLALVVGVWLLPQRAQAHKPSDSYLSLRLEQGRAQGRWDVALRDLNDLLGLDRDADGKLSWGELRVSAPSIEKELRAALAARTPGGACRLDFGPMAVILHSDGAYAALPLSFVCPAPAERLQLHYELLFARDAQHRGVVQTADGAAPLLFTKSSRELTLDLGSTSASSTLGGMLRLGIDHILHGYDHLLFLITLLLPAVLRREGKRWLPAANFRSALADIARVVTAFTLAHSLTLGLAAAGWVSLPPRLIESAIALSVVLAALNNLFPVVRTERWIAAFSLGLLHGFGFAATLADAGATGKSFARSLLGFNLGVELGQLGIVLLLLPVIYGLRRSPRYQTLGLQLGSTAVLLVASIWLVERALDVRIIS